VELAVLLVAPQVVPGLGVLVVVVEEPKVQHKVVPVEAVKYTTDS
jgi:hypothetical protein